MAVRQLSSTIDWITATASDRVKAFQQTIYARHLLTEQGKLGNPREPWGSHGYLGWTSGQVDFGERNDELILRVRAAHADACYKPILDLGYKPTRLDLAVTVWHDPPEVGLAADGCRRGRAWARTAKHPCRHDYYDAADGHGTLYVGSWHSQQFGRLYDRGAKTGLDADAGAWRYEVVQKDQGAQMYAALLTNVADPTDLIRRSVHSWFDSRGVVPSFDRSGEVVAAAVQPDITSDARKLAWLTSQVAPSVAELIERRGAREVIAALGLAGLLRYDASSNGAGLLARRSGPRLDHPFWPRSSTQSLVSDETKREV